jgi:DNA-binding IscR family transcriptional regulator
MADMMWVTDPNGKMPRRSVALTTIHPKSVMAVVGILCFASYLDGFTKLDVQALSVETGVAEDVVDKIIAELANLDILRLRRDSRGGRLVEPQHALRQVYRLLA